MTYRLIVRPAAEDDLGEASAWYERRLPGLGKQFLTAIDATFTKLQDWPDFGILVHKRLRRATVLRFPYGVYYQIDSDRIIVVGVFHNRRAPRRWKSRLE